MITSNHEVILGDQPRKIEAADGKVESKFELEFEVGAKDSGASAIVFLAVRGLVGADAEPVDVDINGTCIGKLQPNANADENSWFTQMLHYSASEGSLKPNAKDDSRTNTIQIPGKDSKLHFDKFYVQNITVLYKAEIE